MRSVGCHPACFQIAMKNCATQAGGLILTNVRLGQPVKNLAAAPAAAGEHRSQLAAAAGGARAVAADDRHHRAFRGGLSRAGVRAVLSRDEIHRQISRARRGADGAAALHAVRVSVRAAAVEQPGHRLHQPVPQPRNGVSADAAGVRRRPSSTGNSSSPPSWRRGRFYF